MMKTRQVVRRRRVKHKSRGWRLYDARYPDRPGYSVVVMARVRIAGVLCFLVRVR